MNYFSVKICPKYLVVFLVKQGKNTPVGVLFETTDRNTGINATKRDKLGVFVFSHWFTVEDGIDQGITTPSPMLSALPDSPSPVEFNETSGVSQRSMWSDDIEYVYLQKEDRGLGFSILDYKVDVAPNTTKIGRIFRGYSGIGGFGMNVLSR